MLHIRTIFRIDLVLFLIIFISCSQVILPYFEIVNFSYDDEKITLQFSSNIDGEKVKKAFYLIEDNTKTEGIYKVSGKYFYYYPINGIQENKNYEISVSTIAEDENGKSLKEKYYNRFSTKTDLSIPKIISITPSNFSTLDSQFEKIQIEFSKAINEETFYSAFSTEPTFNYIIDFNDEKNIVDIIPTEKLSKTSIYTIKINTDLKDNNENNLQEDFVSRFQIGNDEISPKIELSYIDSFSNKNILYDDGFINHNIPNNAFVTIQFSEKINIDYISSKIQIFPSSINFSSEIDKINKDKIYLTINGEFNKDCTLILSKGIEDFSGNKTDKDMNYILYFDNEAYRPVIFMKAYIQIDDKNNFKELSYKTQFTNLCFDPFYYCNDRIKRKGDLYLLFCVSKKSDGIDYFSAIDALSFKTTNSCCSIQIKKAENILKENFIDLPIDYKNQDDNTQICIIKFTLDITNTNKNGIVELNIDSKIKDTLGNKLDHNYSFSFNK